MTPAPRHFVGLDGVAPHPWFCSHTGETRVQGGAAGSHKRLPLRLCCHDRATRATLGRVVR